jgi:hypothetical protein
LSSKLLGESSSEARQSRDTLDSRPDDTLFSTSPQDSSHHRPRSRWNLQTIGKPHHSALRTRSSGRRRRITHLSVLRQPSGSDPSGMSHPDESSPVYLHRQTVLYDFISASYTSLFDFHTTGNPLYHTRYRMPAPDPICATTSSTSHHTTPVA